MRWWPHMYNKSSIGFDWIFRVIKSDETQKLDLSNSNDVYNEKGERERKICTHFQQGTQLTTHNHSHIAKNWQKFG